ncbi:MAG: carbohydrate ABC transporter substrate-binding protein [Ruminococcus sp.]|uniref:ABC transporter substrate-binding protein n=1 Tax=Ruminococcus sp. TaxID=41978 RepID=UPI0025E68E7B|nr:ABC transporter substrate-binding protein [Ruminococcus sp.]MBR0528385.1 carbohydrate ABC transporter substrate-binding protein [Ruminococcus sp.]
MNITKAIAALTSAVLAAGMLTACGSSEKNERKPQTEISFSWWGNDKRNKYTIEAIEKFEELHPDIKVNVSYSEWAGYEMRNKVWMISDTECDVMQINYGWLSTYSDDGSGYFDIDALEDSVKLDNFDEEVLKYGRRGGKLNALPIAMNAMTVYINKTIYDNYGLAVPATWDDLFSAAKVMSKDGIYPLSASSKSMWLYLITYTEQATGKKILADDGSFNFTADDFRTMIEFYKKLVDEKVLPQVEYYERLKLDGEEYAGCVAWVSDANNYFGSAIDKGREIVIAPYTTMAGGTAGEGWYAKPATMYAVSKDTEHPDEAAMLLDFLLNSSEMAELQGVEKGIPLSKSAQEAISDQMKGLQYDASQEMSGTPMTELDPALENGDTIDAFFSAANEYIFDKASSADAAKSFYDSLK